MKLTPQLLELAIFCGLTIQELYPGGLIKPNVVSHKTDTQALVIEMSDGRFAVLFPGTASFRDILTDINIPKVSWHSGHIHCGVRYAWRSVEAGVRELLPPGAEIVVGGHSLGGGIAQACADELDPLRKVSQVITFGGLRTFNRKAAASYNKRLGDKTLRFTNHGDPVPFAPVPLPIPRTGFYGHTDTGIHFNKDGNYSVNRPWFAALPPILRSVAAALQSRLNAQQISQFVSVNAHYLSSYIKRLEALA